MPVSGLQIWYLPNVMGELNENFETDFFTNFVLLRTSAFLQFEKKKGKFI